jgi:hypothetical protein
MKIRSGALALVGVASLLPSLALADWWNQEMIKNQVEYQIAMTCTSVNIQCIATQYANAGSAYWGLAQTTANRPCYEFIGWCDERDELVEDYQQVSYYFGWMAVQNGYGG